jgi:hypothetical protein
VKGRKKAHLRIVVRTSDGERTVEDWRSDDGVCEEGKDRKK